MLAPIILFVYNRPWHTKMTIEALKENFLASQTDLFIYADGAKSDDTSNKVDEVREYIKKVEGFKKVEVIEQVKNYGLSNSIINGVTKVVNEYGKIIVLEDDMVCSPYFIKFMNDALDFYSNSDNVWHISGWTYPIELISEKDVYFYRVMECWGWATWKGNWSYYEKNTKKLMKEFSKSDINRFNLDNTYNSWLQIQLNRIMYMDTWAIYWYATIFKENGLCVNPTKSFVKNIGLDGSGQNCKDTSYTDNEILNNKSTIIFHLDDVEDKNVIDQIKPYLKSISKPVFIKLINKLSRLIVNRNLF